MEGTGSAIIKKQPFLVLIIMDTWIFQGLTVKGSVERPKRTKTHKSGIYQNTLRLLAFYEHVSMFRNVTLFMLNIDTGVIILGFG